MRMKRKTTKVSKENKLKVTRGRIIRTGSSSTDFGVETLKKRIRGLERLRHENHRKDMQDHIIELHLKMIFKMGFSSVFKNRIHSFYYESVRE